VHDLAPEEFTTDTLISLLNAAIETKKWMTEGIYNSRAKDYSGEYRKMVYDTNEEMDAVIGKLEDNSFIKQQREDLEKYVERANNIKKNLKKETVLEER
jgi:hypothetical protein